MRIALFYSGVESFNYFTDMLAQELGKRGHECFVLDLSHMQQAGEHSLQAFNGFASGGVDLAVAFDGLGIKDELFIQLWDSMQTRCVNILMDHPLRFHPTMQKHPKKYIQYCCDRNHVEYVRRYFGDKVGEVAFLPHAGTYDGTGVRLDGYGACPYDVLFSGTYYEPSGYLDQIDRQFEANDTLKCLYHGLAEYMLANSGVTTEQAVLEVVEAMGLEPSQGQLLTMMACAEPIDWMARMHYRKQVVHAIAQAGIDIWLLGRGWENHPDVQLPNYHIINDRVPFAETLPIMGQARINLNVMPWFKDGTHDRIFNILLQGSLPLTDGSIWLRENFTDGRDIAYYDLGDIDAVPGIIRHYLDNPDMAQEIIANGFGKVKDNFTWGNVADTILANA
jgi:hypothetical protein